MLMKFIFLVAVCASFAAPNFSMIGFATQGSGTTGGAGGLVVTPANMQELKQYAEHPTTPYVILINKEFNTGVAVNVDNEGAIGHFLIALVF